MRITEINVREGISKKLSSGEWCSSEIEYTISDLEVKSKKELEKITDAFRKELRRQLQNE